MLTRRIVARALRDDSGRKAFVEALSTMAREERRKIFFSSFEVTEQVRFALVGSVSWPETMRSSTLEQALRNGFMNCQIDNIFRSQRLTLIF
jgi:hypothetical protein